jgi:NAD(P)-dependent dehydrogenase (short-subunit alcohol dehydrogenase family)
LRNESDERAITAARNRSELDQVADEAAKLSHVRPIRGIVADVAGEDDCRRVVSETLNAFGALHILVNNAGRGMRFVSEKFFSTPSKFWQTDPAAWSMIVGTNVND